MELRNIPSKDKESYNDLTAIVEAIGKAVQLKIEPSEIRDVYRLPGRPENNKMLIAEFHKVATKNTFLSAVRQFNLNRSFTDKLNSSLIGVRGNPIPIFVGEHLPASMRKLFFQTREFAKQTKLLQILLAVERKNLTS